MRVKSGIGGWAAPWAAGLLAVWAARRAPAAGQLWTEPDELGGVAAPSSAAFAA